MTEIRIVVLRSKQIGKGIKNRGRVDNMVKAWRPGSLREFSRNASLL